MLYSGTVVKREDKEKGLVLNVNVRVLTSPWATDGGEMKMWVVKINGTGLCGQVVSELGDFFGKCKVINLTGEELGVGSRIQIDTRSESHRVCGVLPGGFLGC